jgi:hypothetical protein
MPLTAVDHLAAVGTERTYVDGDDVMVQGEDGHEFHVVMDGRGHSRRPPGPGAHGR